MTRNTVPRLKWTMSVRRMVAFSLGIATTVLAAPRPASAVPAFARKYGVRCTVCHEAWPVLNDFGRAFRDNGYRMNLGKDEPTATEPAYWPVFAAAQPHFGFDLVKSHGAATETTLERNGQFQSGVSLLGAIGTLGEHASYLVIPVASVNGLTVGFPAGWIRFNNLFDTSWLNVRVGSAEPDLPISRLRDLDLTGVGLGAYAYHTRLRVEFRHGLGPARSRVHGAQPRQPDALLRVGVQRQRRAGECGSVQYPRRLRPLHAEGLLGPWRPDRNRTWRLRLVRHLAGRSAGWPGGKHRHGERFPSPNRAKGGGEVPR
jgi:hypothetical protein